MASSASSQSSSPGNARAFRKGSRPVSARDDPAYPRKRDGPMAMAHVVLVVPAEHRAARGVGANPAAVGRLRAATAGNQSRSTNCQAVLSHDSFSLGMVSTRICELQTGAFGPLVSFRRENAGFAFVHRDDGAAFLVPALAHPPGKRPGVATCFRAVALFFDGAGTDVVLAFHSFSFPTIAATYPVAASAKPRFERRGGGVGLGEEPKGASTCISE